MQLTTEQQSALDKIIAFTNSNKREFALTGAAGTGKSTIIKRLLNNYETHEIVFTATTNKAVKIISSMGITDDAIEFCTIYTLLGLRVKSQGGIDTLIKASKSSKSRLSDYRLVVIDESSMIGSALHDFIAKALKSAPYTQIIYLGDSRQLPPVGEVISKTFLIDDYAELTTIMRQAELSPVKEWCNLIRDCIATKNYTVPALPLRDNLYLVTKTQAATMFAKAFTDVNNTKIIAYRNATVDRYNSLVQSLLYPNLTTKFAIGERIVFRKPLCALATSPRYSFEEEVSPNFDEVVLHTDYEGTVTSISDVTEYRSRFGMIPRVTIDIITEEGDKLSCNVAVDDAIVNTHKKLLADAKSWDEYYTMQAYFPVVKCVYAGTAHSSQGSSIKMF